MVSFGETDEQVVAHLKKYGIDTTDNSDWQFEQNGQGRCTMFKDNQILIRTLKYPTTNIEYGCLQHEIFHAVHFLMRRLRIKLKINSGEAYAYLIGYLTKEIYNKI